MGSNLPWLIQFCAITDRSIYYVRKHRGFCNYFFEFGLKDLLLLGCSLAKLVPVLIQRAHVFQLYQFGKAWCFFPWSRLTMFEILRAGPNLIFMYFIIISSVKSKRAFPSISWVLELKKDKVVERISFSKQANKKMKLTPFGFLLGASCTQRTKMYYNHSESCVLGAVTWGRR